MEGKKLLVAGLLIAVIIAAGIIVQRRMTAAPAVPEWVLNQKMSKIDIKTMDVVEKTYGEWFGKYAPDAKSGRFKNPTSGEYTMVDVMTCEACKKQIPVPQVPEDVANMPAPERDEAMAKVQQDYKCPLCKKSPYPEMPGAPGMPPVAPVR